jgi:hypothetical protein
MISAKDPDLEDPGPAFPAWTEFGRDAILQPSKSQIHPSKQIMELVAGREPNVEAAQ